ncbi:MAG: hypothetical protein WD359_10375 [Dehalococcoidia bacterium]
MERETRRYMSGVALGGIAVLLVMLDDLVVVPWRRRKIEEAERRRGPKIVASGE